MKAFWDFINGLGDFPAGLLFVFASAIGGGWVIFRKKVLRWWRPSVFLSKDIKRGDILSDTQYYIATPILFERYDEIQLQYKEYSVSNPDNLNSVDTVFHYLILEGNRELQCQKYFALLAPTGVGKTVFLYQLFLKYEFYSRKKNVKRLMLGNCKITNSDFWLEVDRCNEEHKKREKQDPYFLPENNILLVDGFDEDKRTYGGKENERKRFNEIIELTKHFHKVILVSRIQFFDNQDEQLEVGGIESNFRFIKLKLQDFYSQDLIYRYINGRSWERSTPHYIYDFVKKNMDAGSTIFSNPFILKNADLIVHSKGSDGKPLRYLYEIYQLLIEKWIRRDFSKYAGGVENVIMLSEKLADKVIEQNSQHNLTIVNNSSEEFSSEELDLQKTYDFGKTERTFLRTNNNKFQFAHRSILEFFIAKKLLSNKEMEQFFNYSNFEMVGRMVYGKRWQEINSSSSGLFPTNLQDAYESIIKISDNQTIHDLFDYNLKKALFGQCKFNENNNFADGSSQSFIGSTLFIKSHLLFLLNYFPDIDNITSPYLAAKLHEIQQKVFIDAIEKYKNDAYMLSAIKNKFSYLSAPSPYVTFEIQKKIATEMKTLEKVETIRLGALNFDDESLGVFLNKTPNLKIIDLTQTNITDYSLTLLAKFCKLETLNLSKTKITDKGIELIQDLKNLKSLILSETKITDNSLESLGKMNKLELINIENTTITDNGIEKISRLLAIQTLIIGGTKVTQKSMAVISNFSNLERLSLSNLSLSSKDIILLKNINNLRELDLVNIAMTDDIVKELANFFQIKSLSLSGKEINDKKLMYFKDYPFFDSLTIINSNVTDKGIARLKTYREENGLQNFNVFLKAKDNASWET